MNDDLKMIFLTESQCNDLMDFIEDYFLDEAANRDHPMRWIWNMSDIHKRLKEVTKDESNTIE